MQPIRLLDARGAAFLKTSQEGDSPSEGAPPPGTLIGIQGAGQECYFRAQSPTSPNSSCTCCTRSCTADLTLFVCLDTVGCRQWDVLGRWDGVRRARRGEMGTQSQSSESSAHP